MFDVNDFVMKTLKGMKNYLPQFQIRKFALHWYEQGALTEDDLMDIEGWYLPKVEEPTVEIVEEIPIEEVPTVDEELTETVQETTQEIVE